MEVLAIFDILRHTQRHHAVITVVAVDAGTGRQRQHLVAVGNHAVYHLGKGFLIGLLGRAQAFIKRLQLAQRNGDGFTLRRQVQPVLHRVARFKAVVAMFHQPGGVDALLHLAGINLRFHHQLAADGFTQN